jgi:hypothetical protein
MKLEALQTILFMGRKSKLKTMNYFFSLILFKINAINKGRMKIKPMKMKIQVVVKVKMTISNFILLFILLVKKC